MSDKGVWWIEFGTFALFFAVVSWLSFQEGYRTGRRHEQEERH